MCFQIIFSYQGGAHFPAWGDSLEQSTSVPRKLFPRQVIFRESKPSDNIYHQFFTLYFVLYLLLFHCIQFHLNLLKFQVHRAQEYLGLSLFLSLQFFQSLRKINKDYKDHKEFSGYVIFYELHFIIYHVHPIYIL